MTENLKSQRWWDLPAALLLLTAILTAATRLTATDWTLHLSTVQTISFFGVFLGLAFGQSIFSSRIAGIMAFLYGTCVIFWQLGGTLRGEFLWQERLSILINRLGVIIYQLRIQETVQDSLLFIVLMNILFWSLSVFAGYTLSRHGNSWLAILPSGLALFVIHSFNLPITRGSWYLAVFLFFGMVLVARMAFLHQHKQWKESRTATPPHVGLDFIRATIMACIIIILLAWTIPALANAFPEAQKAWQPVQNAWRRTLNNFDHVFASLKSSFSPYRETYGSTAPLGRGNPLSDTQVLSARVPADIPTSIRLYWRARTYDTYVNGQWESELSQSHPFNPEHTNLSTPQDFGRWLGSFDLISASNMTTLLTPSQPLWVNRVGQVEYVKNPDETVDISLFRAFPYVVPGQRYKVQSAINYSPAVQLRTAGDDYPEWIIERYLQLPVSISPRTRELAESITEGLVTSYEKSIAITNYLRSNITYVDIIQEELPKDQDLIDWFLFDNKKGFCNYYSTAEIILLRSLGIPARWAIGYAQGDLISDPTSEKEVEKLTYIVRQRDAHSWPEVYFPGAGWIEFEPTTAQPEIVRLEDKNTSEYLDPSPNNGLENSRRRDYEDELDKLRQQRHSAELEIKNQFQTYMVYWGLLLLVVVGLVFLGWRFRSRWIDLSGPVLLEAAFIRMGFQPPKVVELWANQSRLPPLAKAYSEINRALSRLDKPALATHTPAERALTLGQILPPAEKEANKLVNEYHVGIYSMRSANLAVAITSASMIKKLTKKGTYIRQLTDLRFISRKNRQ